MWPSFFGLGLAFKVFLFFHRNDPPVSSEQQISQQGVLRWSGLSNDELYTLLKKKIESLRIHFQGFVCCSLLEVKDRVELRESKNPILIQLWDRKKKINHVVSSILFSWNDLVVALACLLAFRSYSSSRVFFVLTDFCH